VAAPTPKSSALPTRNGECLLVVLLGPRSIARGNQQFAARPVQRSLGEPLVGRFDELLSFGQAFQTLNRLPKLGMRLSERCEHPRSCQNGSGSTDTRECLCEQGEAFLRLSPGGRRPSRPRQGVTQPQRKSCSVDRATISSERRFAIRGAGHQFDHTFDHTHHIPHEGDGMDMSQLILAALKPYVGRLQPIA
jgi:hypothetical protein